MELKNPFEPSILGDIQMPLNYCQMAYIFAMESNPNNEYNHWQGSHDPNSQTPSNFIHNNLEVLPTIHSQTEKIFADMTLAVYDAITQLYLSPIARSSKIIFEILYRMAALVDAKPPTSEAVQIICKNLTPKFRQKYSPTTLVRDIVWEIATTPINIAANFRTGEHSNDIDAVVIWMEQTVISAGLIRRENIPQEVGSILFKAIGSQRTPDPYSQGGVLWTIPYLIRGSKHILTSIAPVCNQLKIQTEKVHDNSSHIIKMMTKIHTDWTNNMPNETKSIAQWELIFDTYLKHNFGPSPKDRSEHQQHLWRNHPKLSLDPGSIFPDIRFLLSSLPVTVQQNGVIYHNQIRHIDPLLTLWEGETVSLRPSPYSFQCGWVYTSNEIICELGSAHSNN